MTQPSFVPIAEADQVRGARHLRVPAGWSPDRPAELVTPLRRSGKGRGTQGPDQGYALTLARRLEPQLVLAPGESAEDVLRGCALLGSRRAALAGRAPCIYDVRAAALLFGFLGTAEPGLVEERRRLFRSVGHEYDAQRRLVDAVPEDSLPLTPEQLEGRAESGWRSPLAGGTGEPAPSVG